MCCACRETSCELLDRQARGGTMRALMRPLADMPQNIARRFVQGRAGAQRCWRHSANWQHAGFERTVHAAAALRGCSPTELSPPRAASARRRPQKHQVVSQSVEQRRDKLQTKIATKLSAGLYKQIPPRAARRAAPMFPAGNCILVRRADAARRLAHRVRATHVRPTRLSPPRAVHQRARYAAPTAAGSRESSIQRAADVRAASLLNRASGPY